MTTGPLGVGIQNEYIIETNNLREEIISYPYIIEDKEKYE